jgi:hypothetical protein
LQALCLSEGSTSRVINGIETNRANMIKCVSFVFMIFTLFYCLDNCTVWSIYFLYLLNEKMNGRETWVGYWFSSLKYNLLHWNLFICALIIALFLDLQVLIKQAGLNIPVNVSWLINMIYHFKFVAPLSMYCLRVDFMFFFLFHHNISISCKYWCFYIKIGRAFV